MRADPLTGDDPGLMLPNGSTLPDFTAESLDGETVTGETLHNGLIAFLSTTCPACKEQLPHYLKIAEQHRALGRTVVTFVHGDAAEARAMAEPLREVTHVVVEDPDEGPTRAAFQVEGYPVFGLVDAAGTVTTSNINPRKLPLPAPVPAGAAG
ncbi:MULTISPECIES: TlpA disulfide reductase family protein [unclassified Streptomyces]|uniref:TlpA family protein disulfide reductase n=1 Tax=unclassified Streptomyces TaxID=2593676 RepID=UPI002DD7D4A4|nr:MULTISPECIES: TlpA disulfide reductase family protein [unclassified Streptomyces]WSA95138.1 TlpA family protein disulfide reductase [Streptomyces sp. NBC_01795]WSB79560.1 TlpA family protein disulfide reductase [Streptomyces sp. NBC_01775]WSS12237.1 TlpA family protein disulfide reductase [Streptomyces sp. NBC_01186]WSS40950.1 TlpA family protein disulfide reductase [Streptomyces sp. NBC_01187]